MRDILNRTIIIVKRELRLFIHRPLLLFVIGIAPLFTIFMFTTLMSQGLPTNLPAGVVDEDRTTVTRKFIRILDSMQETDIVHHYASFTEARQAMQRGEILAFFYFPKNMTTDALAGRHPEISFYLNDAYLVPASLIMKEMKMEAEMVGIGIVREVMYAKGSTERAAMGTVQPIVVDLHPLNNSTMNYSVVLNNLLIPGIMIIIIMLTTCYTIGMEWKENRQLELYELSRQSPLLAIGAKLLPQTVSFSLMFILMDVWLYRFCGFPCNVPIWHMMLLGILTVMASQAFGVFIFGIFAGMMRFSMSICSLWSVLGISLAGFSFPNPAMDEPLRIASWFEPLRHYYLIYVNQALDGFSIAYVWDSVFTLLMFLLLPLTVVWRYHWAFHNREYKK